MKKPLVTLILPAYNEQERLLPGLTTAISYFKKAGYGWEIIIVDDGSLVPVTTTLTQARFPRIKELRIYRLPVNKGKGAAIAEGVRHARGTYIIFSDVDFSVKITVLPDILSALSHAPVVIASRRAPGAVITTHQPPMREAAGRLFTFLSNTLLQIHVYDSTCGLKGFERNAARRLFQDLAISSWVFDAEVLRRARYFAMPIIQVPVHWSDKAGTHVHMRDVIHSWADLFKLWAFVKVQP